MPVTGACARARSKAPFVCFIASSTRASRKKWEPPRPAVCSLSRLILKLEGSPGRGNGERLPENPS